MNISWQSLHLAMPWALLALPLATVPLLVSGHRVFHYPAIHLLPYDAFSIWIQRLWRILGCVAITSAIMAMSQPYFSGWTIDRIGRGAHVMVVLDRSGSMNDDFADKPANKGNASKMAAARRVLSEFVRLSHQDLLGMVTFSTSPILVTPLGHDKDAVLAGVEATEVGGMGFTSVDRGLALALDHFGNQPVTGTRVVLLVSDGAAHLDAKTQDMLRNLFHRQQASLYWIYLRSKNGANLTEKPEGDDTQATPEYALNQYFQTLGVPYQSYQAEDPQAVAQAMNAIAKLKNKPVKYQEAQAKYEASFLFYTLAWLAVCGVLLIHLTEVRQWDTPIG